MQKTVTILGLLLVLSAVTTAHAIDFYPAGMMSFSYQEARASTNTGSFHVDGSILDPTSIPPGGTGACFATSTDSRGTARLLIVACHMNFNGSMDLAFWYVKAPAPLTPGTYDVAPGNVVFGYLDDASFGGHFPSNTRDTDMADWMNKCPAGSKYLSVGGALELTEFTDSRIAATFDVLTKNVDSGTLVEFPDGVLRLGETVSSVESESWGSIKALYDE